MRDYIVFWIAKPIADIAILVAIIFLYLLFIQMPMLFRQARCNHGNGVNETSACDAICRTCGKNLGFIGNWRDRQKGGNRE